MDIYCTPQLKKELKSLLKLKSYRKHTKQLIEFLFNGNCFTGTIINGVNPPIPLVKKRINSKKELRIYYYLFENREEIYLVYVHPKTGPKGRSNISKIEQTKLLKELLHSKENKTDLSILLDNNKLRYILRKDLGCL